MSAAIVTLDIINYMPPNFKFDNFSFIFSSGGHDFEDVINYISRNQISHKTLLNKRDLRYSITVLRNESLIGICDFVIPYTLLSKKESAFEKVCAITITDSTKRLLFGNISSNNSLKIVIHADLQYIQEKMVVRQNAANAKKDRAKAFSPKGLNNVTKKTNVPIGQGALGANFVFNKQQIPMNISGNKKINSKIGATGNINKAQNKLRANNNDMVFQKNKRIGGATGGNNYFTKGKVDKGNKEALEDDPNDTSELDEEIAQPIQLLDNEFTEFMSKFIEKNPLEQLSQFKDINEMLIYTKNVIDKLLCYQQEYYERLKSSVILNHRLNELLLKYNEKYRNIVKKVHRLNEETNSNNMKKDAVIKIHRAENSNLKQIIPLKLKELKLYQEMCGNGLPDIGKEEKVESPKKEEAVEGEKKIENLLIKLFKNCINNYGPIDKIISDNNISEEEKNNIKMINDKIILSEQNKNEEAVNSNRNETKLEYVISDNPDDMDTKLENYLHTFHSMNKLPVINFKKTAENNYEYGTQKLTIFEEDDEVLKVKVDGKIDTLENFLQTNAQSEINKLN